MTAQIVSKRPDPVLMSNGLWSDDQTNYDGDAWVKARNGWKHLFWENDPQLWQRVAEGKRRD